MQSRVKTPDSQRGSNTSNRGAKSIGGAAALYNCRDCDMRIKASNKAGLRRADCKMVGQASESSGLFDVDVRIPPPPPR